LTEFIHEVAVRMGDLVDDYAIMNEVNTDGFWKGTQAEYEQLEILAYDTLKQYDTIDANGDGIAATVYPSSSNEPGQTALWQEWYAALQGHMDGFNTHDYKWGLKPSLDIIQAWTPRSNTSSETGPPTGSSISRRYGVQPAWAASAIGYLTLDTTHAGSHDSVGTQR
jgi:hypothetical protein